MLLCSLILSWSAAASSAPDATGELIAALGRPAPARTAFAEARFMQVLERPLVVSGELAWLGGDTLERHVTRPHEETARIAGGEVTQQRAGKSARSFSLERAPQLRVLVDSFVALLGGDAGRLRKAFAIARRGDAAGAWTLTLTPRDVDVARTVASIRIDGQGREARCMWMQEADGDVAVDLLGPLAARMPDAPTRESLATLCRGG
ncbi:LolA-related protein [Fulvimonas yonginensis]|uniref:LolA-related protein n=1 Tax=Fulvimonas yonginensis TaxID=1495200 RepID=A0ABU8J851_9GAMM